MAPERPFPMELRNARLAIEHARFEWVPLGEVKLKEKLKNLSDPSMTYILQDENKYKRIGDFTQGPWNGTLTPVLED